MAVPLDKTSANKLTVAQLKKELEARAIDYGAEGLTKKQQLIQRLMEVQDKEQNKNQSENKKQSHNQNQSQELPHDDHIADGEAEKNEAKTHNRTEQHGKSTMNVHNNTIVNEEENDDIRIVKAVKLHENATAEQVELVKTLIKRVEKFGAAFRLSDNDRQQLRIIKFGKSSNADVQKSSNSVLATTTNGHKVDVVHKGKKRIIVSDVQEDDAVIAARAAKFGLLAQSNHQPSKKQHNGVDKNSVDTEEQALRVARAARFGQPLFPLDDHSHVAEATTTSCDVKRTSSQ